MPSYPRNHLPYWLLQLLPDPLSLGLKRYYALFDFVADLLNQCGPYFHLLQLAEQLVPLVFHSELGRGQAKSSPWRLQLVLDVACPINWPVN